MKVKANMKLSEVNVIMENSHDSIARPFGNDSIFVQFYESPSAASDSYAVVFSKDSVVVGVKYGD